LHRWLDSLFFWVYWFLQMAKTFCALFLV